MALPEPECGLVVSYSYLWSNEQRAGKIEGLKNRPCAIVLVAKSDGDRRKVTVAPITHTPPALFKQMVGRIIELRQKGLAVTPRD